MCDRTTSDTFRLIFAKVVIYIYSMINILFHADEVD